MIRHKKVAATIASHRLRQELAVGYRAMASEDRKTAARRLACGVEATGASCQRYAVDRALRISLAPDWLPTTPTDYR
jgi:hypothetical protein